MSDLTLCTATLGRPSLAKLVECVAAQTSKDFTWLVVFDGSDAFDQGSKLLASMNPLPYGFVTHPGAPRGPGPREVIYRAKEMIRTKYIAFADDDNLFAKEHVEVLTKILATGARFAATNRVYVDDAYETKAVEHPGSELVDTNCMALETKLFYEGMEFAEKYWTGPGMFDDRHLQAYLFARGIRPLRAKNAYTVKYRVNPKRFDLVKAAGSVLYETILSERAITMGKWRPAKEAK